MIRVELPAHLRVLARTSSEISVEVTGPATQNSVIDAVEAAYPPLRGTIRDYATHRRRAMVRLFACGEDISHVSPDAPLPVRVADGSEALLIVAAIAGG